MRLEGWKGQQRVAATPQRHVRRYGRCEGSPLEGVRQGSDGFSLLCLCPLRVPFMCLWLSPPCWELAEGRLSPLSFQELHEGRNHGPVPSDTSPSASGTVRLHWVAPPIRKCAPGAGMLSASVPAGSQARRRELCICHQWTTFLPGNAPPHQPPKAPQLCTGVAYLRCTRPLTRLGYLGQVEVPARPVPAPPAEAPSRGMTNTRPYITTINSLSPPQQPLPQGSHSCPYP